MSDSSQPSPDQPSSGQPSRASRLLFTCASLVIVVAGLRAAQPILLPFLISVFLAVISFPAVHWMTGRRVPAWLAVTAIVTLMMGIGLGIAALAGTSLNDFSANLPGYQTRLAKETEVFLGWLESAGALPSKRMILDQIDPGAAMGLAAVLLSGIGAVFANTFLILLTVVFILLEVSSFPVKLRAAFGDRAALFPQFSRFSESVIRYLAIKTAASLATGAAVFLWLWVLGVDFPLLWGLLAFLLNFVPNIGSAIAAVPPVLLALIQFGVPRSILVAGGFLLLNFVVGNIVEPRFLGRGLGLSTLVVFLSLVFWGWLWGAVGMLLSVPLTMTLKIALESRPDTRWIAVLLGSETIADPSPGTAAENS